MKRTSWFLCLLSLTLGAACAVEKSENPLSPTLAGPIPGVEISAPKLLEPSTGALIAGNDQPLTLLIENASSTGPRPLSYVFEVATDGGFANKVFQREGIEPGTGGRTSLRLPDALGSGRNYYWRSKAQDGANTGPYSAAASFNVFTPVAFDKPGPISPVNNALQADNVPDFKFTNAPRAGSPTGVTYSIEISTSSAFAGIAAAWSVVESPSGTTMLTSPAGLPVNAQLFWRVRATDGGTVGPFSDIAVFRTPAPVVATPPPSGPPSGGGTCASQPTELAVVTCRRNQFGHMDPGQLYQFLRLVASDLNAHPFSAGPYGILEKTSGNNCNGFSCDIICGAGGRIWDTLGDSEGAQVPTWGDKGTNSSRCVIP